MGNLDAWNVVEYVGCFECVCAEELQVMFVGFVKVGLRWVWDDGLLVCVSDCGGCVFWVFGVMMLVELCVFWDDW